MITVEATTFSGLAERAADACADGVVYHLVLRGRVPVAETRSAFIEAHMADARNWQSPHCNDLFFTHGQYIGAGRDYVIAELKQKQDSNRACVSLLNVRDIIGSDDNPIPAFLLFQAGFASDSRQTLYLAVYFRALEVSAFLPINLAEMALIIDQARIAFPQIEEVELIVVAFRAYLRQGFSCLHKSPIDVADSVTITLAVAQRKVQQLREWIAAKRDTQESVVSTHGITTLRRAIDESGVSYDPQVSRALQKAVEHLEKLKQMRKATSHGSAIQTVVAQVQVELDAALEALKD